MFQSADSALKWAALMRNTLILDGSSINDMCGKPTPPTRNGLLMGLSPQEAQQQAANIVGYANAIKDPVCVQYIQAKYFFIDKLEDIVHRVLSGLLHAAGGTHRRDIRLIVQSYIGVRATRRQMRAALRCRMADVIRIEDNVYRQMDKVHHRTMGELEEKLIEVGLIYN